MEDSDEVYVGPYEEEIDEILTEAGRINPDGKKYQHIMNSCKKLIEEVEKNERVKLKKLIWKIEEFMLKEDFSMSVREKIGNIVKKYSEEEK